MPGFAKSKEIHLSTWAAGVGGGPANRERTRGGTPPDQDRRDSWNFGMT